MGERMEAGYYSVIPANVRYDNKLPAAAKLLYSEITALATKEGYCYATNEYFSQLYGVTERSIIRWIQALAKAEYVFLRMVEDKKSGTVYRRIYVSESAANLIDNAKKSEKAGPSDSSEGGVTKLSPPDKNVTPGVTKLSPHTLLENNTREKKEKKEKRPRKPKNSNPDDVKAELDQWADTLKLDAEKAEELKERLHGFVDLRASRHNPMSTGQACTYLENKLTRYSCKYQNGEPVLIPEIMIEMLDKAIYRNWDSVYPLKADEAEEILGRYSDSGGGGYEEKWL